MPCSDLVISLDIPIAQELHLKPRLVPRSLSQSDQNLAVESHPAGITHGEFPYATGIDPIFVVVMNEMEFSSLPCRGYSTLRRQTQAHAVQGRVRVL